MINMNRPDGVPENFVQAFYAVSLDRPGNSNGQLNSAGMVAAERGSRVLSLDPAKARAAVDAYQARGESRRAKVGWTWCVPQWIAE